MDVTDIWKGAVRLKRIWLALLVVSLLAWGAPVSAEVRLEIVSPADKQAVSGMVDVAFAPLGHSGSLGVGVAVAPGFDAKTGFREVWMERMALVGTTAPMIRFSTEGFGSGPYTMRVTLSLQEAGAATAGEPEELVATRNFVMEAPDRAPKLALGVPNVVAGVTPVAIQVADEDLAHWTLEAVDHEGFKRVLSWGDFSAAFEGAVAGDDWHGWPTAEMIRKAKEKNPNLGVRQPPTTLDLSQWKDGEATLRLWAVDLFGNEAVMEKKVMVQNAAPPRPVTISSPGHRQSVTSPALIAFDTDVPFWHANAEVARGFDATSGFRRITQLRIPSDRPGVTNMSFDWEIAGLSGGPYTLRIRVVDPKTEAVLAAGTRNFTLNAPDYSPALKLEVPQVVNGAAQIVASVSDVDAHHWELAIVGDKAQSRTLASARNPSFAGGLLEWIPRRSEATHRQTFTLPASYDLSDLPTGSYTVRLHAVDSFWNESVLERKVIVNNPPPSLLAGPSQAEQDAALLPVTYSSTAPVTVKATVSSPGGNAVASGEVQAPAGERLEALVPVDLSRVAPGRYTVSVEAEDAYHRKGTGTFALTVVDVKAPEPGIVSVAAHSGAGLNLRWEEAVDGSGIAGYRVFLVEAGERRWLADLGASAREYSLPLPPGQYAVVWQALDQNGHMTEVGPIGFEVRPGAVAIWHRGRFLSGDGPWVPEEGRTWVPLRLFGEALGYEVFWDNDLQVATLRNRQSGRMLMTAVGEDSLQVMEGPVQVKVAIGAAPRLVNGRVMVPLRALVEALGAKVNWVQATQTVELE